MRVYIFCIRIKSGVLMLGPDFCKALASFNLRYVVLWRLTFCWVLGTGCKGPEYEGHIPSLVPRK